MAGIDTGDIAVPPPPASIKDWPFVGEQLYSFWLLASTNLRSAFTQVLPQRSPLGEYLLDMARTPASARSNSCVSVLLIRLHSRLRAATARGRAGAVAAH